MKTDSLFKLTGLAVLILVLFASCSAVFDAGVNGYVYYYEGSTKTPVADAKVYVYSDSNGTALMASTRTDANGAYTVSRVVWESQNPDFGKTADYATIYIRVTHDDFESSSLIPVTIISDSTNDSLGDVELVRKYFPMPVFSGRVTPTESNSATDESYDYLPVWLCYKDGEDFVRFVDDSAQVNTTSTQLASYDANSKYSHGNFSNLGGSRIRWEGSVDEHNYASTIVYIVFDANRSLSIDSGDTYADVVVQSGKDAYQVTYNEFTGTI